MSRIKVFSAPNPNAPVSSTGNYSSGTAVGSSSTVYASQNELDAISQSLASATDAILDNTNRIIDYVKADTVLYTEELPSNPNSIWGMLTGTEPIKLIDNPIEMSPDKQSVVTNYDELKELYNALRTSR